MSWKHAGTRLMHALASHAGSSSCISKAATSAAVSAARQAAKTSQLVSVASISACVGTRASTSRGGPALSLLASSMLQSRPMTTSFASQPPVHPPAALTTVDTSISSSGSSVASGSGCGLEAGEEDDTVSTPSKKKRTERRREDHKQPPDPTAAQQALLQQVELLPRSERLQARERLTKSELDFLWRKAQDLLRAGDMATAQLGARGPTAQWRAYVGDLLESKELVRVTVSKDTQLSPGFVGWLLEQTQDCVVVKVVGGSVTLFRDVSLPRPVQSRADATTQPTTQQSTANPSQQPSQPTTQTDGAKVEATAAERDRARAPSTAQQKAAAEEVPVHTASGTDGEEGVGKVQSMDIGLLQRRRLARVFNPARRMELLGRMVQSRQRLRERAAA